MKVANELKVGLVIIVCAVIFFLGVRYFEAIPLFRGTYELYTTFDDGGGLQNGNMVRINGVSVGSVTSVELDEAARKVRVRFKVDEGVRLYEGSYVEIAGIAALGDPLLSITLGPSSNPLIAPGGLVPSREDDLLGRLADRAPGLIDNVEDALAGTDEVVASANATLGAAEGAFSELEAVVGPGNANLRQTLAALTATTNTLNAVLRAEQARLAAVLTNVEGLTGDLRGFTGTRSDSLGLAVDNLNSVLRRLDQNLVALETTTSGLDTLFVRLERGDGTLGLLVNDPGLYLRMDSALVSLNRILTGFEDDPRRYLKDLRLVDIF